MYDPNQNNQNNPWTAPQQWQGQPQPQQPQWQPQGQPQWQGQPGQPQMPPQQSPQQPPQWQPQPQMQPQPQQQPQAFTPPPPPAAPGTYQGGPLEIAPSGLPVGRYDLKVKYVETNPKVSDSGVFKGYVMVFDFEVMSGPNTGRSFRQWFTTYAATDKYRKLCVACGKPIQKTPDGKEVSDPSSLTGSFINGEVTARDNFQDLNDPKPLTPGNGQGQPSF